jgi:HAD superfamily hydrolase (TIGR01509 family)
VSSLLIFDCDGVLVDSEPLANQVLHGHIRELGIEVSLEESTRTFTGLSMGACVGLIEEMLGGNVPDNFVSRLRIHTARVFADGLRPVTGIETILPGLDGPLCVASSGSHAKIRLSLKLTGLRRWFPDDAIFSAEDVQRGKPAPDLFLHAAEAMGVTPSQCTVVEDSVPGVTAARAAGMRVFGYAERTPSRSLEAAGATVFSRMEELAGLLGY